jgi:Bacterial proteasome activator
LVPVPRVSNAAGPPTLVRPAGDAHDEAVTSAHAAGRSGRGDLIAPAKAVRLLGLLSDGLGELDRVSLDEPARSRLAAAHRATLVEVASVVSDPLIEELVALHFQPLDSEATPDEIRVAHAQLAGWVNGLLLAEAYWGTSVAIDDARDGSRPTERGVSDRGEAPRA